ncbi:hypothetical protein FI667_g6149, partial [Globisporangium splendens]
MHRVSDQLRDRHPHLDLPFQESYNPKEVSRAFGARAVPKYAELLVMDDLSDKYRVKALQELHELLSNQETKYTAGTHEILFSCADLGETSRSSAVRMHAALVIPALVLYEIDKPDELGTETMLRAATTLLSDIDKSVIAAACTIFRNVSRSNQGALLLASSATVIEFLMTMFTRQPIKTLAEPILTELLAVLANITRVFQGVSVCSQYPVLVPALDILKHARLYPSEVLLHAVLVISNFAIHDQGKREAIAKNAVEICLNVLTRVLTPSQGIKCETEAAQVELTRCVIGAIMGLSTYEEAKPRILEFGVESLVACLKHPHPSIQQSAAIAVNSACESPLGAACFTRKLLADKVLLCLDMLDMLMELVLDPQREIHHRALLVLQQICKIRSGLSQEHCSGKEDARTTISSLSATFLIFLPPIAAITLDNLTRAQAESKHLKLKNSLVQASAEFREQFKDEHTLFRSLPDRPPSRSLLMRLERINQCCKRVRVWRRQLANPLVQYRNQLLFGGKPGTTKKNDRRMHITLLMSLTADVYAQRMNYVRDLDESRKCWSWQTNWRWETDWEWGVLHVQDDE